MRSEEEILKQIKEAEVERSGARTQVSYHKKAVVDSESRLIAANLNIEKLQEELRRCRLASPIQPPTTRELDIAEFRKKVPELMKRIK